MVAHMLIRQGSLSEFFRKGAVGKSFLLLL